MGWFRSKLSDEERKKCLAYLEEEWKLRAFYAKERNIHEEAIAEAAIRLNSHQITSKEFQEEICRASSRLAKATVELLTRRSDIWPVPDIAYEACVAWETAYSAYSAWATAQASHETEYGKVYGLPVARAKLVAEGISLKGLREHVLQYEKCWQKAINEEKKLVKRLKLSDEERVTLLEEAENAVASGNWQPQEAKHSTKKGGKAT